MTVLLTTPLRPRASDYCPVCGDSLLCMPESVVPVCAHPESGGCGWHPTFDQQQIYETSPLIEIPL